MLGLPASQIDAYLAGLDEPARTTLEQLRADILAVVPNADQGFAYGLPAFKVQGKTVAGFGAHKHHLSYLPHSGSVLAQLGDQVAGYDTTKGSLKFAPGEPLPPALVRALVSARLEELGFAAPVAGTLYITGDPDADRLLNTDGLALLIGMLLDQQVPMGWAFQGPATLRQRLGNPGPLDAARIAAMDPEELVAVFVQKPALHRYPAAMARRTHELCAYLVDHYDGDATGVWRGATTGQELAARLRALPGYGQEKSMIFVALLAKRMGVAPPGWQEAAGPFADAEPRSVADCTSPATLEQVKAWKQAMREARRDKQGRPL